MINDLGALFLYAETRHGVFTTADAARFKIKQDRLDDLRRAGVIRRLYYGTYAVVGTGESPLQELAGACTWTEGLLMGRAAVRYYELRGAATGKTELLVTHNRFLEHDDLVIRRTRRLDPVDIVDCGDGIRVTSVARSLLDYAAFVAYDRLETGMFDARHKGLVTDAELGEVAARLGTKGRQGIRRFRRFLDENDPAAGTPESELEVRMLRLMRTAGLTGFEMQLEVGPYRLDFPFPDVQLDVEVDGAAFHTSPADVRRDHARDKWLRSNGWGVLRFDWFDVVRRPEWTITTLETEVATRRASAA